jgi:hypothetical protein
VRGAPELAACSSIPQRLSSLVVILNASRCCLPIFKRILSLDDFGYEVLTAPKMYLRRVAKLVANRDPKTHTPPHPETQRGHAKGVV